MPVTFYQTTWCHTLGDSTLQNNTKHSEVMGFWTLSIVRNSKYKRTQRFGKWICFHRHMRGRVTYSVGSTSNCITVPLCTLHHSLYCLLSCYISWTQHGVSCLYSCCYVTWVVHWLRLGLSKGPNRVGVFPFTWGWEHIQFPKRCSSLNLEFGMMAAVQKPSTSECCTPSLEPFRVY
jgi:hypothetical protein